MAGLPGFEWPDHDVKSVEDDVAGRHKVLTAYRPDFLRELDDPRQVAFLEDLLTVDITRYASHRHMPPLLGLWELPATSR